MQPFLCVLRREMAVSLRPTETVLTSSVMAPTFISPWLQILQGLLTPVIGLTTLYIAWQQFQMNRRKTILERYERRLQIYQRTVEMIRLVVRNFKPEFQDLIKFSADAAEADFLFGEEIPKYINEIYVHGLDLNTARAEYRDFTQPIPAGYDHQKVVDALTKEKKWFTDQPQIAKEKFKKYLDISK